MARLRWRDAVLCGLIWGLAVTVAISLGQPIADISPAEAFQFAASLTLVWCPTGVVWAVGVKLAEDARRPRLILPFTYAASWAISFGCEVLTQSSQMAASGGIAQLLANRGSLDLAVYNLWLDLLYGGLYAAGYLYTRRTQRLHRNLAGLRLARQEAEAALREARLRAVRGQMQPAMLLDALDSLRGAYAADAPAGERLFDHLVAFLRAAMPGLRSGASTLAAELTIVRRYAELRAELPRNASPWRLNFAAPPRDLPFPPLRLLPALDRVSRLLPVGTSLGVTAQPEAGGFLVRVEVEAAVSLAGETLQALRTKLRRDLGPQSIAETPWTESWILAEVRVFHPRAA